ncbi:hypothetical protein PFLUV_G00210100 [Perca fluviatilis]|uniref:Uncharacterized protein n=1 Tax=Perca fluviatilis TaxID=8168 RepID=A0A6A5EQH0_PERFL|nr:hypothetical protein PFLUV_G00210100 [Perca fluviatilis]
MSGLSVVGVMYSGNRSCFLQLNDNKSEVLSLKKQIPIPKKSLISVAVMLHSCEINCTTASNNSTESAIFRKSGSSLSQDALLDSGKDRK